MMYYNSSLFKQGVYSITQNLSRLNYDGIHAVPRGGAPLAVALSTTWNLPILSDLQITPLTLVVDDIIDSGKTRCNYPHNDFAALCVRDWKQRASSREDDAGWRRVTGRTVFADDYDEWVQFWWEKDDPDEILGAEANVMRLIQKIGEDFSRPGLEDTPGRVLKSYKEIYAGYDQDPADVFKVFDVEDYRYDQMVLLKDISFYSMCEHHMLPFFGKAHIAYIPSGNKVIGLSKLARLLEVYTRRMQIQERIGTQVTDALEKYLSPIGAACVIDGQHLCMQMRGVNKQEAVMTTSSLTGVFKTETDTRQELFSLIGR